jgi:anaerobic selenocysteine-containing dehydrogenase
VLTVFDDARKPVKSLVAKLIASRNRSLVLCCIRNRMAVTPTSISRRLGLQVSAVSRSIRELKALGLLSCVDPSVRKGRKDYPFYLITFKSMYRRQSGDTAMNPLLYEIARRSYNPSDENRLLIHPEAAKKLGIRDGDLVVVESLKGKIKIRARLTEGIRPDTVAISWHYGHWSRGFPDYAKKGANPNLIMELKADVISGQANFNDTKVKVYRA